MQELIDSKSYIVELTPVKQKAPELKERLDKFISKYNQVIDAGYCVSIPDNPMGHLSFQCTELIEEFDLPVPENRVLCHVNTFHTADDIENILASCKRLGIHNILIISGDGSDRLPKLQPQEVGADTDSVTTVELARYIRNRHDGEFRLGAAFNQYEPEDYEFDKLKRKIEAGVEFIITQPVVGKEEIIHRLIGFDIPVFLEAWMSKNTGLLADCIGYDLPPEYEHDPMKVLNKLTEKYPQCGFYTALLGFKSQFPVLDDVWAGEVTP
jgi:methylenetetrahydrofolate reductase (NADPH)